MIDQGRDERGKRRLVTLLRDGGPTNEATHISAQRFKPKVSRSERN